MHLWSNNRIIKKKRFIDQKIWKLKTQQEKKYPKVWLEEKLKEISPKVEKKQRGGKNIK